MSAVLPAVVPVAEPPAALFVVRLRLSMTSFSSAGMPEEAARALAEDLGRDIVNIGDTWRFVDFVGREGRMSSVRAREVIAIDVTREIPEGQQRHARVGSVPVGHEDGRLAPPSGTAWLQQRAGRVGDRR